MRAARFTAWEFFAGGGMARAGLGKGWDVSFANDLDPLKADAYAANFGAEHLRVEDVWKLTPADLPGRADLAWASSPCQDFSLAGARAGLGGGRSSALLGFLDLMRATAEAGRGPRLMVIENVVGLLTSSGGRDFAALGERLTVDGWRFRAVEVDAAGFLPQSRPRLFVICSRDPWEGAMPSPPRRNTSLEALLDADAGWDPRAKTDRLLSLAPPLHAARVEAARASGGALTASAYRRIREVDGRKVQRAELRFDGMAGCLRTPAGGSSRQFVVQVADGMVRSRKLTAREGARLMGLQDDYALPRGETNAWRVVGDGVAVPVVRWLAEQVLEPMLPASKRAAA